MSINGLFPSVFNQPNVFTNGLYVYNGPVIVPSGSIDPSAIRGSSTTGGGASGAGFVNLLGDQSIGGLKTFTTPPSMSGGAITAGTIDNTAISGGAVTVSTAQSVTGVKTISSSWIFQYMPNMSFSLANVSSSVFPTGSSFWGYQCALSRTIAAVNNTLFGYQSGLALTSGTDNTFFGYLTGKDITTGSQNTLVGSNVNTNQGGTATVSYATALGANTLAKLYGVAVGALAQAYASSVAIGYNSYAISGGTAIGYGSIASGANSTAIGTGASTTTSNQIVLGTTSETVYFPGGVNFRIPPIIVGTNFYPGSIPNNCLINTPVDLVNDQTVGGVKTFTESVYISKLFKPTQIIETGTTTMTWASPILTLDSTQGTVFFFSTLTSNINFTVNYNPGTMAILNSSYSFTLFIDTTTYKGYANVFQYAGTPYTIQFAGGASNVLISGATSTGVIMQTITILFKASTTVPYRVISSVSACY